jgi:hypothetical protein
VLCSYRLPWCSAQSLAIECAGTVSSKGISECRQPPTARSDGCTSAHSREGPPPARAMICRPQRQKRPPRKLADAAERGAAEESGGERLFDHVRCDTLSLLCRAPFRAVPTQDVRAGRGAKGSAAQAFQDEAGPSAGQPQHASERGVRSAAAALSQRATETEISEGRHHYFGACLMGLSAVIIRCRLIAFVARHAHPLTMLHACHSAQG